MKKYLLIISLAFPALAYSASFLDKVKSVFSIGECLQTKTETMCTYEQLFALNESSVLEKEQTLMGASAMYVLFAPSSNWYKMFPGEKRKEDLVMMDKSGHAMVQVDWLANGESDYKAVAKEELKEISEALQAEPTEIALDVWPYNESGVFYEICYNTNKKTVECMYSAVANIPGGMVNIFAHTASDEKLVEDIVYIIASIDVPARKVSQAD